MSPISDNRPGFDFRNHFNEDSRPKLSRAMAGNMPALVSGGLRYKEQLGRMADLMNLTCWPEFLTNVDNCEVILVPVKHNQKEPTILVESQDHARLGPISETCEVWATSDDKLKCTCATSKRYVDGDFTAKYCFGMCVHAAAVMFQDGWFIIIRNGPVKIIPGKIV